MTAPALSDALAHLQGAMHALSNEAYEVNTALGTEKRLPPISSCISEDLLAIERRIGAKQPTLIGAIGEAIREALVEICAAHAVLSAFSGNPPAAEKPSRNSSDTAVGSLRPCDRLERLGLLLDISAARLNCAVARAAADPAATDDWNAQLDSHESLRAKYRLTLAGVTGTDAAVIERRLAL